MPGPGQYRSDPTEGTTRIDDLPRTKVACRSRNYRRRPCPRCGHSSYRDRLGRRHLHDLRHPLTGRPPDLVMLFHAALKARGLGLQGITTDGSALYPGPIAAVCGQVPHQLCTFHVLKEVTKAVLSAVAQLRKGLTAGAPKLPRGRPGSTAAR